MEEIYNIALAYLSEDLSSDEKQSFEEELRNNPVLAEELNEWKHLINTFEKIGDESLRNELNNIENELDKKGFFITDEQILDNLADPKSSDFRSLIENTIQADSDFEKRVEAQRQLLNGIETFGDELVKNSIKNVVEATPSIAQTKIIRRPIISFLKYAAVFFACTLIGYFGYHYSKPNEELVQVQTPPQNLILDKDTTKSDVIVETNPKENTTSPEPVKKLEPSKIKYFAFAKAKYSKPKFSGVRSGQFNSLDSVYLLFDKDQFKAVINAVEKNAFQSKYELESKILLAHSYFNLKEISKSIFLFKQLQLEGDLLDTDEIDYYLMLCYLSDYKQYKNDFDSLFNTINRNENHRYREKVLHLGTLLKEH